MTTIAQVKWILLTLELRKIVDDYTSLIGDPEPLIYSVE